MGVGFFGVVFLVGVFFVGYFFFNTLDSCGNIAVEDKYLSICLFVS